MILPKVLGGNKPFFLEPNYLEKTKQDFASKVALAHVYRCQTESKVWRVAKVIIAIIIFPIGMYFLVHLIIGRYGLLPASRGDKVKHKDLPNGGQTHTELRMRILEEGVSGEKGTWRFKRLSIQVNGKNVDLMIVGKEKEFYKREVVLFPLGRNECYEFKVLKSKGFKDVMEHLGGIAVIPNYQSVGASEGLPTASGMIQTIEAAYRFCEDNENTGLNAKKITVMAHSVGCAVDSEVLLTHKLRDDIDYISIRRSGFASYAEAAGTYITKVSGRPIGILANITARIFGWNIGALESSLKLKHKEIIIQTMKDGVVVHDGVVGKEAALATHIEKHKHKAVGKKHIHGIDAKHDESMPSFAPIKRAIEG